MESTLSHTSAVWSPKADQRSDLFSFDIVLHEMLTGRNPFRRENTVGTISAIARDQPADAALPPDISAVVRRCFEKKPEDRYQTSMELVNELSALVSGTRSGPAAITDAPERLLGGP